MRDFTKIKAWALADELAVRIYRATTRFPSTETSGIVAQLRRAATWVAANIAEGSNRASKKEYIKFPSIAAGSVAEVKYFLSLSSRLGYLTVPESSSLQDLAEKTSKTLTGLLRAVRDEVFGNRSDV